MKKAIGWAVALAVVAGVAFIVIPVVMLGAILGASSAAGCADEAPIRQEDNDLTGGEQGLDSVDDLNDRQRGYAQTIIDVGRNLNEYGPFSLSGGQSYRIEPLGDQSIVIALTTALTETRLVNYANDGTGDLASDQSVELMRESLTYPHDDVGSDHGSMGLFQQQAPWWGSPENLMDPATSASLFYAALNDVDDWRNMEVGQAAQEVQVSAVPSAYRAWEPLARQILATLGQNASEEAVLSSPALCGSAAAMECPPTGLAAEEGLTPDALRVLRCVRQEFGDHGFGGVGERAANPGSDHPAGRAVDVMIRDWETDESNAHGWLIAEWLRANAAALGVKYVIWDAEIWSVDRAEEGWRAYTHPSGADDPTNAHLDHVHVSVYGNSAGAPAGEVVDGWTLPVQPGSYRISSRYGPRPSRGDNHTGLDFAAPEGTPVRAAAAGTLVTAGNSVSSGYGIYIKILHDDGTMTLYAHLSSMDVPRGITEGAYENGYVDLTDPQLRIAAGQVIGGVGSTGNSTGPHLHFEVRVNGRTVDPEPFFAARGLTP